MARLLPLLFVHIALCGQLADAEVLAYKTSYRYLEKALQRFVQYYHLDPVALPDVNQTFEKTYYLFCCTVPKGVSRILTNGSLAGLSTIRRTEYFLFGANRKGIEVHADFGVGPLHLHYAGNVTLVGISYGVDVIITIQYIRVVLQVFESLTEGLVVKDFRIKRNGRADGNAPQSGRRRLHIQRDREGSHINLQEFDTRQSGQCIKSRGPKQSQRTERLCTSKRNPPGNEQ
uniref:Putative secreted protein n=1 Tax=Ixodes ricinus TaxID=34613 RepID=V5H9I6_IXORI